MPNDYEGLMGIALEEARESLKEGNNGFGAVIVKNGQILVRTHDREESEGDPTSHAELNAIRLAAQRCGRDLGDCTLVCTHEPCPMCATAVVWSGMKTLVYGYSIAEALAEGRKRIDLTCRELFARAKSDIRVYEGVLHDQCSILYRKEVRDEIKRLRNAKLEDLEALRVQLLNKRVDWFKGNYPFMEINRDDLLLSGYQLLLTKLSVKPEEAPVVLKNERKIVFHSQNFCPTLEACKILDLDTRVICQEVNEGPTDALVKQISDRLEFRRNYEKLRPYCDYCEEMIILNQ